MLSDALRRCLAASDIGGARGIVAHAFDDDALRCDLRRGFLATPLGERVVLMPNENVRAMFAAGRLIETPRRAGAPRKSPAD